MKRHILFQIIYGFKKFFGYLIPPHQWRLPVIIILGILIGLVMYIGQISNATSYLSDDPRACVNCHVMVPQYATWKRSSHAQVASCTDCHVPHDNVLRKYKFKMKDGLRHATIFTLRKEPQVIMIKSDGVAVVQENCIRCHTNVVQDVSIHKSTYEDYVQGQGKLCWDCHREVPHGRVGSLSATPHALVPESPDIKVLSNWLKGLCPIIHKSDIDKVGSQE